MNIKEINTEKDFTKSVTKEFAKTYIERTLRDASKISINLTWGFDEAQGGGFHNNWTAEEFLQCIEKILQKNN